MIGSVLVRRIPLYILRGRNYIIVCSLDHYFGSDGDKRWLHAYAAEIPSPSKNGDAISAAYVCRISSAFDGGQLCGTKSAPVELRLKPTNFMDAITDGLC